MAARACPNCGHPLSANARFCVNCGQMMSDEAPVAVVDETKVPWRAREALWIFGIVFLATAIIEIPIALFVSKADTVVALSLVANEGLLLIAVLVWARTRHGAGLRDLGLRDVTASNIFTGIGVGFAGLIVAQIAGSIVVTVAQKVSGHAVSQPKQIQLQDPPSTLILMVIGFSVIVLAPLAEELFFRGFLFRGLRTWMRVGPALVLSSAIFAIAHVYPLVMIPIFVLGLLLAGIVERRGSLVPSMFAHATFNTFGFIVGYVLKR